MTAISICLLRLAVRTPGFHPGNRGSTPLGDAIAEKLESVRCLENVIVLNAADLTPLLDDTDRTRITTMNNLYDRALEISGKIAGQPIPKIAGQPIPKIAREDRMRLIELYNEMGEIMQEFMREEPAIRVYSFETPREVHGEASRLIAKLRAIGTPQSEFIYYIQRAYELLFNLAYAGPGTHKKNYLIIRTPVSAPVPNLAVHKIPDIDDVLEQTVMCVMLRGALLPSMILSKEIQEYSSEGYITPFALFSIRRDDTSTESDMTYTLDLKRSYFRLEQLDGKDLVFADPMNATGGSLITIVNYLLEQGVRPRSIQCFNVISSFKGTLRIVRTLKSVRIYTLWMDPALNEMAYVLPGLGDAGDRINGVDVAELRRDIIQLIADYGSNISNLYRAQVQTIEATVLQR